MTTLLIDGDILVYKIAYSVEVPIYVVGNSVFKQKAMASTYAKKRGLEANKRVNIGSYGELTNKVKSAFKQIFEDCQSNDYKLFITNTGEDDNFRHKVSVTIPYKANRLKSGKPFHYLAMRQILIQKWGAINVIGQEADDALATEHTKIEQMTGRPFNSVIVSVDKDLLTVAGRHYNINSRKQIEVSKEEAWHNFCRQLLIGDNTDNIPGIVRRLKLLNREEESFELSHHQYIKKFDDATVDLDANKCYNYVYEIYKQYGLEKELGETFNLCWLRRYEGQNGWEDFNKGKLI